MIIKLSEVDLNDYENQLVGIVTYSFGEFEKVYLCQVLPTFNNGIKTNELRILLNVNDNQNYKLIKALTEPCKRTENNYLIVGEELSFIKRMIKSFEESLLLSAKNQLNKKNND